MKTLIAAFAVAAAFYATNVKAQTFTLPSGTYVGLGGNWEESTTKGATSTGSVNGRAGYNFNKYIAAEVDVTSAFANGNQHPNTAATVNLLAGVPVNFAGSAVKPYGLVGTGYDFSYLNHSNTINTAPVYNVGAGVEYDLNKNVFVDVRYTYVDNYNNSHHGTNQVGAAIGYKF